MPSGPALVGPRSRVALLRCPLRFARCAKLFCRRFRLVLEFKLTAALFDPALRFGDGFDNGSQFTAPKGPSPLPSSVIVPNKVTKYSFMTVGMEARGGIEPQIKTPPD